MEAVQAAVHAALPPGQTPSTLTPVAFPPLPESKSVVLWRVPYDQLRKHKLEPSLQTVCTVRGYQAKVDSCGIIASQG